MCFKTSGPAKSRSGFHRFLLGSKSSSSSWWTWENLWTLKTKNMLKILPTFTRFRRGGTLVKESLKMGWFLSGDDTVRCSRKVQSLVRKLGYRRPQVGLKVVFAWHKMGRWWSCITGCCFFPTLVCLKCERLNILELNLTLRHATMPSRKHVKLQAWTAKSFLLASCISTLWRKDSSLDTVETDLPDSYTFIRCIIRRVSATVLGS